MAPLGLLSRGEQAEILEIKGQICCKQGSSRDQLCHIEDLGLRAGKMIEMLNNEGRGPILLKVEESRIAIGRGMAMKIMVRRKEQ
ncbi:MAG TPA: ferrous iron transport protein A [Nitrospiraceae bacterium]|nr:ferrous iron transport protein A [Nitrospiraceae bacterium]